MDLKKRVSLEAAQQHFRLFEKIQNKPFWILDIEEQRQEDITRKNKNVIFTMSLSQITCYYRIR